MVSKYNTTLYIIDHPCAKCGGSIRDNIGEARSWDASGGRYYKSTLS